MERQATALRREPDLVRFQVEATIDVPDWCATDLVIVRRWLETTLRNQGLLVGDLDLWELPIH
jgi:hypothetical protein